MPFLTGITFRSFGRSPFKLRKIRAIVTATGGTITTPGNGFRYHTFTNPGTFSVSDGSGPFEVLVVGGGGSPGGHNGGGGGGGGVRYITNIPTAPGTSHSVIIGAGGGPSSPTPTSGNPSTFGHPGGPYVSLGGGRGGTYFSNDAQPGGCGGGGSGYYSGFFFSGGSGTPSQGFPGGSGNGNAPAYGAGGGGGAGGSGSPGSTASSGPGGNGSLQPNFTAPLIGVPTLSPLSGHFAAGGGGSGTSPGAPPGSPGLGTGVANSGGGGVSGYSGIVIVRYQYEE